MTDFSVFWNCLMTLVTPDTHDTHVPQKHGDYGFVARKLRDGLAEITASLTEGFVTQMTQIAQIFFGSLMAQKTHIFFCKKY